MIHYHLAKTQMVFGSMIIGSIFISQALFAADPAAYLDILREPLDHNVTQDKKWEKPSNGKSLPDLPPNVVLPSQPVQKTKPATSKKEAKTKTQTHKISSNVTKKYPLTEMHVDSGTVKSAAVTGKSGIVGKEKVWPINTCFKGLDANGKQVDVKGVPHGVVAINGQVMVELCDQVTGNLCYVNPIALQTEPRNEHPADKSLRFAREEWLSFDVALKSGLQDPNQRDQFFTRITFEYIPGKYASGIIVGMNADSSYNVLVKDVPPEWKGTRDIANPNYFVVYPEHTQTVVDPATLGFNVDPKQFGATLRDQVKEIFKLSQTGVHSSRWAGDMLRQIGVKLDPQEKDALGFTVAGGDEYFSTARAYGELGPWRIRKIGADGSLETVYDAPGRITGFIVNPLDHNKILISAQEYNTDDLRYQSLFEYSSVTKKETVIDFPGARKHGNDKLFMNGAQYGQDGLIYISRYGFENEGGGIWALDPSKANYGIIGNSKALMKVNHIQDIKCVDDFLSLDSPVLSQPNDTGLDSHQIVYTVKEVSHGKNVTMTMKAFSATLYSGIGIVPAISNSRKIAKFQGWEPRIAGFIAEKSTNNLVIYFQTPEDQTAYQGSYAMAVYKVYIPLSLRH